MAPDPNPYSSPRERSVAPSTRGFSDGIARPRLISAAVGSGIGLAVGVLWAAVFGPLTDGPPSLALSFLVYTTGLAATGFVVGAVRRLPPLIGAVVGMTSLSVWALIAGPQDFWMELWLICFGGSGLLWGCVIGCVFWLLMRCLGRTPSIMAWPLATVAEKENPYTSAKATDCEDGTHRSAQQGRSQLMVVFSGILVIVAYPILFAAGGGLVAAGLNRLAPGYYPGVFPHADRDGHAMEVGLGTGILQGLALGLVVAIAVTVGLGCFRQLRLAVCVRALMIIAGFGAAAAIVGALIGYGLGTFSPGYYRGVISGGRQPSFNPVDVGIGLGCSQGLMLGVLMGVAAVGVLAWRRSRAKA